MFLGTLKVSAVKNRGFHIYDKHRQKEVTDFIFDLAPKQPKTQAQRIIDKFGGVPRFLSLLEELGKKRHKATVYKWLKPKSSYKCRGGTGGTIPANMMSWVLLLAQLDGVILTSEDLDPRPRL